MNEGHLVIKQTIQEILESPNAQSAGVYRMLSADGELLYVGKAKNLPNRIKNYLNKNDLSDRIKRMIFLTRKMEIITTKTEAEALILEANLIYNLQPRFNILLKDDKSFPYIHLRQDHDFPQICKYRGKKLEKRNYFGPFASSGMVSEVVSYLQRIFLLRPCSDEFFKSRIRPCLQFQIKRCSAPCVGKISKEDYASLVKQAKNFLDGNNVKLQQELSDQMHEASQKMEFEKAAVIRDRIKSLTQIQAKQDFISSSSFFNADIFAIAKEFATSCVQVFFIRNGQNYGNQDFFPLHAEGDSENEILSSFIPQFYQTRVAPKEIFVNVELVQTKLIEEALSVTQSYAVKITFPKIGSKTKFMEFIHENAVNSLRRKRSKEAYHGQIFTKLQEIFSILRDISRIEVFDNSHISGTNAVGGMICAGKGGFLKKEYRKFNIKTTEVGDDHQMMREVFTRRLKKLEDLSRSNWPDLCIIDGGKGHLNTVIQIAKQEHLEFIKFVSIAKAEKRNEGNETFFIYDEKKSEITKLNLENSDPVMKYLQTLRDEVHGYAISSHRAKRAKNLTISDLDSVPLIGKKRKQALLNHFASIEEIRDASIEQLAKVENVSLKIAEKIYNYFHK